MNELTKTQQEAVQSSEPATLVIAGPGTGKTHILASRIQFLVSHQGVSPQHILCLTFTESGANAMRSRIVQFLGTEGYQVSVGTFHSFAASLIDEHPELFGYRRNLKALADIDRAKVIRDVMDASYRDGSLTNLSTHGDPYFYYYEIASAFSTLKREGIAPNEFSQLVEEWRREFDAVPDEEKISTRGRRAGSLKVEYEKEEKRIAKNEELVRLYERYEETLVEENRYDFDDMINRARAGIEASEELREELYERYRAILVDEYQDTNGAQNKLLFSLINPVSPNVFVVGDDDQAIQRFQGATLQNFTDFVERFPNAAIVALADNFRSPQFILDAALSLAKANTQRISTHLQLPDKTLLAQGAHAQSKEMEVKEFANDTHEHTFLLRRIKELSSEGVPFSEIAVLTRANREQKVIADLLRAHGIPYTVSADQNALSEPRTASLFVLAEACRNPHNDSALISFLRHPATSIALEDVYRILAERKRDESVYDALLRCLQRSSSLHQPEAAKQTFATLNSLCARQETSSGAHWLQAIIEETGFLAWALSQEDSPFLIANLRALTDEAKRVQEGNEYIRIDEVMDHFQSYRDLGLSLKPKLASISFQDAVRVMTAHQSKGQEFEYVFIVHAVEGNWSGKRVGGKLTLPSAIAAQQEDIEDARRLFYVALTRAKRGLTITYATSYPLGISGQEEGGKETIPSIFVTELSEHLAPVKQEEDGAQALVAASITPAAHPSNLQKEVTRSLVSSPRFALNATSINTFLDCPNAFLYECVLRVPKVKNMALTYGEAIHLALQRYFEVDQENRSLDFLMQTVQMYLDERSTLTEAQNRQLFGRAEGALKRYHEEFLTRQPQPIAVEKGYRAGEATFGEVRLSGKIDKIAPLSDSSKEANVVDYKTNKHAKSANAVLGKTKDKDAPKYLNQLMFYKLLLSLDETFEYEPTQFTLDFVDEVRQVSIPIDEGQYETFCATITDIWTAVQDLSFLQSTERFPFCGKCQYCATM